MTEIASAKAAYELPDGQWVIDATGKGHCLIDTHLGWPQRMAAHKRSLVALDGLEYPLQLADFVGDCDHGWGTRELGHCYNCGKVVGEPRPLYVDIG